MATQIQAPIQQLFGPHEAVESAWYAVQTSARHEKQVAQHLSGRGIEHFLPLYEEMHRWSDRRTVVQLPLFPGYVFARFPLLNRMAVLQAPGVAKLVSFGGIPAAIEGNEIDALQRGISGGMRVTPHPYLKLGCRVRVCHGPLQGIEGVLVKNKEGLRVVISVELIMRSVAVEVDSADIKVLS